MWCYTMYAAYTDKEDEVDEAIALQELQPKASPVIW